MQQNYSNPLPVGVFDSGVGGLTVAREIFRNLPNEKIIYFGDTARVPYGNKSPETIIRYSRQIVNFLISKGVKAIVIACNTASALALDAIKNDYEIPIIGVVRPGSETAVKTTTNNRIGVIATAGTISSGIYGRYIKELLPDALVFGQACPLFVPLVEEGMIDDSVTVEMIHRYIDGMISQNNIDTLILGCTHYPLLRKVIAREIKENIKLVNPAYETAQALKRLLEEKGLASDASADFSDHQFFASDGPDKFREFAEKILELDIHHVNLKVLE